MQKKESLAEWPEKEMGRNQDYREVSMVPTTKRPKAVTIIGGIFIIMAIYTLISSGIGIINSVFLPQIKNMPQAQEPAYKMALFYMSVLSHPLLLAFVIISSIVAVVASIYFFRLRPWARTALEIIAWLYAVYTVGTHLLFLFPMLNFTLSQPTPEMAALKSPEFKVYIYVISSITSLMWALPTLIVIYFLRKKDLREAFRPSLALS